METIYARSFTAGSQKSYHLNVPRLIAAIRQCSQAGDMEAGRKLHLHAVAASLHTNKFVGAVLITMYGRCGVMVLARQVFEEITQRDVVVWNSLILGYVTNGEHMTAINLFSLMDCEPSSFTFVAVLKACGCLASDKHSCKEFCLEKGIVIHERVEKAGLDILVGNSLIVMYSKCGSMVNARHVFETMHKRDVVSWNSLIMGYVENGDYVSSMELFTRMDCKPDSFTYVAALKACGSLAVENDSRKHSCLENIMEIHRHINDDGLQTNVVVATTLLDMYIKCGSVEKAREVFDGMVHKNVITWTALVLGYAENGQGLMALELFMSMGCKPDSFAFVAALKACGSLADENVENVKFCIKKVVTIHSQVNYSGLHSHVLVANALIALYTKCSSTDQARLVFDSLNVRDVVTWNTLILGYLENDQVLEAMALFTSMELEPNSLTYVAALKACGSLAAIKTGREIHASVCRHGMEGERTVANILLDLYVKCGSLNRLEESFNSLQATHDLVSWNTLIAGHTSLKDSSQVLRLVNEMKEAEVEIDDVTFISILTACSHTGLLVQAQVYFGEMLRRGIRVSVEHYSCMVDLLCRTGKIAEALILVHTMPLEANPVTWMTLLRACREWKNVEVGKIAFDALLAVGTRDSSAYVLMRDICAGRST